MSSRRRSRSRDKKNVSTKLRMDTKPQAIRITDPSLPAGRRREIDNVMKKARAQKSPNSGVFWDKKLLEVEAKDPNRWRHSGYKSLYIDGSSSPSSNGRRSRSRSPLRHSSSPTPGGRRTPSMRRASPAVYGGRSARSPRSPRSPPPRSARSRSRSSSPPTRRRSPPSYRRSLPRGRPRSPPSPREPPSSRHIRRSVSNSSISSCSDDSCSVCSPKGHRNARSRSKSRSPRARKPAPKIISPPKSRVRQRPPSPSPVPRRVAKPTTPPPIPRKLPKPNPSDRPTDPRRQPPPPRPRGSTGEIINVRGVKPPAKPTAVKKSGEKQMVKPMLLKRIKKERTGNRPGSPGAESSGSADSGHTLLPTPIVATTSLTLSERFGKIAQWSADRERREMENMRITKTGSNMKVLVEEDDFLYGSPPRRYSLSPVPTGHFPDKLMSSGQSRMAAWDDVRVRYQYYKDLGYLRDLTLDDYVKWEEWWYKYQDWLANERHYEHWLASQGGGRRRGKKRLPASKRLN
ncbi:serine/arginine repetitive matrix protein 1 isoform X1 [Diorhabda sublineata]|uniref:serine/arginine repetitive matrix protein 1 isoform X1 n=2 Tax=Diorhabda sublineata TaxID=1163346 RepID=UPI0024E0F756|nr:serine/arginine repetitive matrix protein 1 isoform X1 [Diorhabda sublineata]XP_056633793.1 serine/arginine repetitive matrix protein 1 isoform X1 [Diorhabda sublineata]XP_056633794.1 serine/arginine repetitive matrix protein 1 isoform X1 [Diorhabda sublineata]XP_056633796.1 serine/arginine repetitive matrix protein 1 isoform X1 [Diorhabda sublineata]